MIEKVHFILYVKDQKVSTEFYSKLLNIEPSLYVPGMTEFCLSENSILGIMPAKGIEKLLKNKIEVTNTESNKVKAELYLVVDKIENYMERAVKLNVGILSLAKERDWGHKVAYLLDPDQHIIAIAELMK